MKEAPLFIHGLTLGSWQVPAFIVYTWLVMGLLIVMSLVVRSNLKAVPGGLQNFIELFIGFLKDFTVNTMGPHGLDYFPLIGTAAFFILVCNLMGIVPGFESPTANLNTTGACALVVVATTHIVGVQKHGLKYIKHFLGPVWWLIPLMFFIEVIGHVARLLSLSLRLFGNISGMSHHTGPRKCFMYLKPCFWTPTMWVVATTTRAHAPVVFRFAVGDSKPGTMPMR